MALFLQIILAVVLVLVAAALIPLLLQARRTAAAIQTLADSARVDLHELAAEVHQVRVRVDQVADLAVTTLEVPAQLGALLAGVSRSLPDLLGRSSNRWLDLALSLVRMLMSTFLRPKKEDHHE